MYCHKCGRKLNSKTMICAHCGSYSRKRGKGTNWNNVIIRSLIVIVVVLFILYLIKKASGN